MPFPQKERVILNDDLADVRQLVTPKASIVCQRRRFKPELRITAGVSHMNVGRFAPLQAVEEESVPANP